MTANAAGPSVIDIEGRQLRLTNLDRVLWPDEGYTKGELIDYLVAMAPVIMPHLVDRPLVLTRYPGGVGEESFYQKNTPATAPDWLRTWPHRGGEPDRVINYLLCDHVAVLAWLGNQAAIEIHPWFSRIDQPELPDIAVFDLDPVAPAGFDQCRPLAELLRGALARFGLHGWPKTSGATGLHVYVPIARGPSYREIAWSVGRICDALHESLPDISTRVRKVRDRPAGTVYLDHLQNVRGKTLAMPYGPRPRPGAPVSLPFAWDELRDIAPATWTIKTAPARVRLVGDVFRPVATGSAQDWRPVLDYFGKPP